MMQRTIFLFALLVPMHASAQAAHGHHAAGREHPVVSHSAPVQSGQGAFAAIQEIVEILEADSATDWSKVNIEALRQHLIDMDNVTLHAEVKGEPIDGGMRFVVSGAGPIRDSIQRMITAHAMAMNGAGDWKFLAVNIENGAILTVMTPPKDSRKLHGLGFIGVLTHGMHHQQHHLMIARGDDPHH